jgi:hypothetical protein
MDIRAIRSPPLADFRNDDCMKTVDIEAATADLPALVEEAIAGEEILLARGESPWRA